MYHKYIGIMVLMMISISLVIPLASAFVGQSWLCDNLGWFCSPDVQFQTLNITGNVLTPYAVFNGWRIIGITGNESILYDASIVGDTLILKPKSDKPIIREECIGDNLDLVAKPVCKNVTYYYPDKINLKNAETKELIEEKDKNLDITARGEYEFELNPSVAIAYKLGEMSIILEGDTSYNSIDTNITQETGFAHLNISNSAPYDKLLAYWSFDRDTSTTAYDFSKFNRDGTYTNGANSSCSYFDNATCFDSVDDYITMGNTLDIVNNSYTFSFWINSKNYPNGNYQLFMGKYRHYDATNSAYIISTLRPTTFRFVGKGTNVHDITVPAFQPNKWYHITATIMSNGNTTLWINGTRMSDLTGLQLPTGLTNTQFRIGDVENSGTGQKMNGTIDDVMIFNGTLTDAQVLAIYQNQSSRFMPKGEMVFEGINLGTNTTANISLTDYEITFNSNLSAKFNDGGEASSEVFFVNGVAQDVSLTSITTRTDLNLTLNFYAGNNSIQPTDTPFYTPIVVGNITVKGFIVGDTTKPLIQFVSPTDADNSLVSRPYVIINVTATDETALDYINITLYNSSMDLINATKSTSSPLYVNISGLSDGTYYFNATARDDANNFNYTETRTIKIDTTPPLVTITSPLFHHLYETGIINLAFNWIELGAGTSSIKWWANSTNSDYGLRNYSIAGSPTPALFDYTGSYNLTICINDSVGLWGCANTLFHTAPVNKTTETTTTTTSGDICPEDVAGYYNSKIPHYNEGCT